MPENNDPTCHFCATATDDEHLCHGCQVYVCADCEDIDNDPWGAHDPVDHPAATE